ncbi:MAG: protein kinase [Gemmatimonadota bacterium]
MDSPHGLIPNRLAAALADRYHLDRELGQGGMATVYLAEDLKHGRRVAIKVLRPELAAVIGPERFVREIRTIAALQHPHVLGLIDSGEVDGTAYYVMPFIDGESLRDRLDREKQLPIADAIRLASEVASALDYAHRHGVIHRDIKPENILLHDGQALVADFGIALAASKSGGARMTETGMSLGTPHYMSPEQAMGEREITGRSDVYALGIVTYEMLTGDPPFTGSTAQAIVARMMTETPRSLVAQRHTIPQTVERAVLTALEKLPADRFATAAEFAAALHGKEERTTVAPPSVRRRSASALPWAAAAVLAVVAAAGWYLAARNVGGSAPPMVFGQSTRVTWDPGLEILPAISPDGRSVAYASGTLQNMQIYVRPVAGGRSIRLTDDSTGIQSHPRWSPDGTRVLFMQNGGVFSAPAAGGPGRPEVPAHGREIISAVWSPEGKRIAWVANDSIFIKEADGSTRPLAQVDEPTLCSWSPNGALIACSSGNTLGLRVGESFGNISPSAIVVSRLSDGRVTKVTDGLGLNENPIWSPDGRWLYFVSNRHGPRDLYGQRITGAGAAVGAPTRLTTGLNVHTFSLSADGARLAYANFSTTSNIWSVPLNGSLEGATKVTSGNQNIETANVSADRQWLYFDADLAGNMDLYRMRLRAGAAERLTTDPSDDFDPQPSPDGREVAFHSWRGGSRDIYVMPLDGGQVQRVTSSPRQEALASWSPDGNALVFCEFSARGSLWIVRRVGGVWGQPVERLDHGFWPEWSPDGRNIAFTTHLVDGSVSVVPADAGPERAVTNAATGLLTDKIFWSADGASLLFRARSPAGERGIYRAPSAGGEAPKRVGVLAADANASVRGGWGYSGDRAYLSLPEQQSDVSVIEVAK